MDLISGIAARYAHSHPQLKIQMRKAHIRELPGRFVKKCMVGGAYAAVGFLVIAFLFQQRFEFPLWYVPVFGLGMGLATFTFFLNTPLGLIKKRAREIDEDVLFIGRYLLVKIESGEPLYNTLIDAAKASGVSSKYLKEIVDDITAGKPIEEAIEFAWEYNSSEKFKRVLFQILSGLRTGTELGPVLKTTLRSLTSQQILEVKEYGKKLNSFMMFYLIMACIMPSLGLTMLVVFSSFIQIELGNTAFIVMLFFLVVVQIMFIILIKASRPAVNI